MKKLYWLIFSFALFSVQVFAQATGDYQSKLVASPFAWGTAANWETYNSVTNTWSTAAAAPTVANTAGKTITILAGHTISINASIAGTFTAVIDVEGTLTDNGNRNFSSSNFTNNGTISPIGGTWTFSGAFTNTGTINSTGGTIVLSGAGPTTLSGGLTFRALTISAGAVTANVPFTTNGTFTVSGAAIFTDASTNGTIAGNLAVTSTDPNAFTSNTLTTFSGTTTISGAGAKNFNNVTVNGTMTPNATYTVNGNINGTGTLAAGTGTATIAGTPTAVSGTGAKNFNNLFVNSGATLSGTLTGTISGTLTNHGIINFTGGTLTLGAASSAVLSDPLASTTFNALTTTAGGTFTDASGTNVTITGNYNGGAALTSLGTITFSGAIAMSGAGTKKFTNLAISGTLTPSVSFEVDGDLSGPGALNTTAGIATFGGTGAQAISGGTKTFFNVTINSSAAVTYNTNIGMTGTTFQGDGSLTDVSSSPFATITFTSITIAGAGTKDFENVTIAAGTTTPNADYTIRGNLVLTGTLAQGTGTTTFAGTTTQSGTTPTFNNVVVSLGASLSGAINTTINGTFTNKGTISFTGGTLTLGAASATDVTNLSASTTFNALTTTAGATFTDAAGTNVTIKGNYIGGATITSQGTITFSGAGVVTMTGTGTTTFQNLAVTSGTLTPSVSFNVNGNLSGAGALNTTAGIATFGGTGAQAISGGTKTFFNVTINSSAAVTYNTNIGMTGTTFQGDGSLTDVSSSPFATITFTSITIAGAGTKDFENVTIAAGTTTPNADYTIRGNLVLTGTLAQGTGTTTFAGTTTQSGTTPTFNNVVVSLGASLSGAINTTINGTFTNKGTISFTGGTLTLGAASATDVTNLSASTTFNALTTTAGATFTDAAGTNVTIKGNYIGGATITSQGTITFSGAGVVTMTGTGTTTFQNLAVTSGTLTPSVSFNVNGNLSGAGALNATAGTATFGGTTLVSGGTKTFFNVTLNGSVTLNTGIAFTLTGTGALALNSGIFSLNGGSLTVGTGAITVGTGKIDAKTNTSTNSLIIGATGAVTGTLTFTDGSSLANFTVGRSIAIQTDNVATDNITVTTLSMSAGTLSKATGTFTMASGGSVTSTGGILSLGSPIVVAGAGVYDLSYNIGANLTTGGEVSTSIRNFTFTVTGVTARTLTLGKPITTSGTFSLTGGTGGIGTFTAGVNPVTPFAANSVTLGGSSTIGITANFNALTVNGSLTQTSATTTTMTSGNTNVHTSNITVGPNGTISLTSGTIAFSGSTNGDGTTITNNNTNNPTTNIAFNNVSFTANRSMTAPLNGTINVTGNFGGASGTFTHNNSTVIFAGSSSLGIGANINRAFYDVKVNNGATLSDGGGAFTVGITVANSLANNGIINFTGTATTLTLGANSSTTLAGTSTTLDILTLTAGTTGTTSVTASTPFTISGILTVPNQAKITSTSTVTKGAGNFAITGTGIYDNSGGSGLTIFSGVTNFTGTGTHSFKSIQVDGTVSPTGASYSVAGDITGSGTLNAGTGTSKATFVGTTTISGSAKNFNNVDVNSGASVASAIDLSINGTAFNNNGTINLTGGLLTLGASCVTVLADLPSSSTLFNALTSFGSSITAGTPGNLSSVIFTGDFAGTGSYVSNGTTTFNGTTAMSGAGAKTFKDLVINGTSMTPGTNINYTVNGNLSGTGILNAGTGTTTTTFGGTTTISGTGAKNFNNVMLNASRSLTLPNADINIAGNVTLDPTATFIAGTGRVILNGAAQNLTAASATFNDLTLLGSGTKTFSATTTIAGTLSINSGVFADLGTITAHTANELSLAGLFQTSGKWGSTSSSATNKNAAFAGTGFITVATGTNTFYSIANSDWGSSATWSNTGFGGLAATSTPSAGALVYIGGGKQVTVLNGGESCTSLVFDQATSATNSLTISGSLAVSGSVTIPQNGGSNTLAIGSGSLAANGIDFTLGTGAGVQQLTIGAGTATVIGDVTGIGASSTISFSGAGLLQVGGTLFTSAMGTLTTGGNGTVEYNADGNQIVQGPGYNKLKLSGSGDKTLAATSAIGGDLDIESSARFVVGAVSLTVAGTTTVNGPSGTLWFNAAGGTKTFTGMVTLSGGTWDNTANEAVTFQGGITNSSGTFNAGTGIQTFDTNQALTGTFTIPNVTVTGATVALTNNGTLTVGTALSGTGTLAQTASTSSILNIGGNSGITTLDASANASGTGNTVNYTGAAPAIHIGNYFNLNISGAGTNNGTLTVAGALSGVGSLTQASGATLNIGGTSGITSLDAATNIPNTVNYTANSIQTVHDNQYVHLGLSGTGAKTLPVGLNSIAGDLTLSGTASTSGVAALTIGGSVVIGSSATFTAGAFTHQVGGDWTNNTAANFAAGTSNITFAGTGTHSINGTSNFYSFGTNSSGTINLLGATGASGILTMTSGSTMNTNNNLTLLSTSETQTGSIGNLTGVTFNGNVTVQRYFGIADDVDRFISSPVSNATVAQLQQAFPITGNFTGTSYPCTGCLNNAASFKWYNETLSGTFANGYTAYPSSGGSNTSTLVPGVGYEMWMWNGVAPTTVDFYGSINQGPIAIKNQLGNSLSYTNSGNSGADGWNLVGNPFPSAIQWNNGTGWNKGSNIDPTVWIWDIVGNVWHSYNANTHGGDIPNGIISIGQAFWVYVTGASSGLTITEDAKSIAGDGSYYRKAASDIQSLVISLNQGEFSENSYLISRSQTSGEGVNSLKPIMGNERLSIAIINSNYKYGHFALSGDEESIPLFIYGKTDGEYTISFSPEGSNVFNDFYLVDLESKISTQVLPENKYTFSLSANQYFNSENRFVLTKKPDLILSELGTEEIVKCYPNPATEDINIEANSEDVKDFVLINSSGNVVAPITLVSSNGVAKAKVNIEILPSGLYFIKGLVNGKVMVEKIVKYK